MKKFIFVTILLVSTMSQAATFDVCVCQIDGRGSNFYLNGISFVKQANGQVEKKMIQITSSNVYTTNNELILMCDYQLDQFIAAGVCPQKAGLKNSQAY